MNRDQLARAAHEINRAYCAALGDATQVAWEDAPDWQQASALLGVDMHLANPDATPEDSHASWLAQKEADGWKFGPVKDAEKKEHPCFMPYDQLPAEQKAKDYLFRAVVHTLKDVPGASTQVAVDSAFTPVKYIGARENYTDGTYGTKINWSRGDTRMVPVAAARLMLTHKDVYELGEAVNELPILPAKPSEEDDTQDMRDAIANMDHSALATYAKTHFNVKIDKRKDVGALRAQVTGLFDQFGLT